MAPFPRQRPMRSEREEERLFSRWTTFAAALLMAALFGLLSGTARDGQFPRGVQSADRNTDTPHFAKREPIRALAAADRKDGAGTQNTTGDGALVPASPGIAFPAHVSVVTTVFAAASPALSHWPTSLPRAPPSGA